MTLKDLPIGKTATVTVVGGEGALRQHFLDMGIIPMADVTMVKYAPMGDPIEIRIHSYELTLRLADAAKLKSKTSEVRKLQRETSVPKPFLIRDLEKEANTTKRQMSIPFRKESFLPSHWQETRTAARLPCSTS